tara:strand:+ start:890 stop:1090 length:201 start_codon:yes stop_codon:yes gene_type:complete
MSKTIKKDVFVEGLVDKLFQTLIDKVNADRKKKKKAIMKLTDPEAKAIFRKHKPQLQKTAKALMDL